MQVGNVDNDLVRDLGGQAGHVDFAHGVFHQAALGLGAVALADEFHVHLHLDLLGERDALEVEMPVFVGNRVALYGLYDDRVVAAGGLDGDDGVGVRLDEGGHGLFIDGDAHRRFIKAVNDGGNAAAGPESAEGAAYSGLVPRLC